MQAIKYLLTLAAASSQSTSSGRIRSSPQTPCAVIRTKKTAGQASGGKVQSWVMRECGGGMQAEQEGGRRSHKIFAPASRETSTRKKTQADQCFRQARNAHAIHTHACRETEQIANITHNTTHAPFQRTIASANRPHSQRRRSHAGPTHCV